MQSNYTYDRYSNEYFIRFKKRVVENNPSIVYEGSPRDSFDSANEAIKPRSYLNDRNRRSEEIRILEFVRDKSLGVRSLLT